MSTARYGSSPPRSEDDPLLRGAGRYTDDLEVPGAAHGAFVRAPVAHAAIRAIDAKAALALPGVLAVFTGADVEAAGLGPIPPAVLLPGRDGKPMVGPAMPVLAQERVRYVGEPVALVVAQSAALAQAQVQHRPDLQPQPLDHRQEQGHARRLVEEEMDVLVDAEQLHPVGLAALHLGGELAVERLHAVHVVHADAPRGFLHREALDRDADAQQLAKARLGHHRHADAPVGEHLQRPFRGEAAHRLAHRHRAHVERRRELAQRELLPGLQLPGHQVVAQSLVDALAERARLHRRDAGEGALDDAQGGACSHIRIDSRVKAVSIM